MTAVPRNAVAMAILTLAVLGCRKPAPGSCREDVDCPPGFDCASGACARRQRMTFAGPGGATPREDPPAGPPMPQPPRPSDLPAVPPPPAVKPKAAPPHESPPIVPVPSVPEQRLPAWKQRLKNT
jgi:hypothetical protein